MRPPPDGISVIVPAYNEEKHLPATLGSLIRARDFLDANDPGLVELLVVDNGSTDQTAGIAGKLGARVVQESEHNIASVRNTGARTAARDILVFVDADTSVPESVLWRIHSLTADPNVLGGAVDTDYRPTRLLLRVYLRLWRLLGRVLGMAQGATQFCRREVFVGLGGYDEQLYMGEDVDFFRRLKALAKARRGRVPVLTDVQVVPSCRRFDQWSLWRTLVWTNPLFIVLCQRRKSMWHGWYENVPR